jgi:hypothetical protein
MRTFNGLQIFTQQLTNSGQLDARYVRISGNTQPANLFFGDLTQEYDFYKDSNFQITNSANIFYCQNNQTFTGFMPDVVDKTLLFVKNLSPQANLILSGYNQQQIFDQSSNLLEMASSAGMTFFGFKREHYTGWAIINETQGVAIFN